MEVSRATGLRCSQWLVLLAWCMAGSSAQWQGHAIEQCPAQGEGRGAGWQVPCLQPSACEQSGEKEVPTTDDALLGDTPSGQDGEFLKSMQRLLNASRKLDAKVRKPQAERQQMNSQWKQFQDQLKASFVAQRQQYAADVQTDSDMLEMRRQKAELLEQIQEMVTKKGKIHAPKKEELEPAPEDIAAWHQLMAPTPRGGTTEVEEDDMLRQALQEPEKFLQHTLAELARAPGAAGTMEVDHGGQILTAAGAAAGQGMLPAATPRMEPSQQLPACSGMAPVLNKLGQAYHNKEVATASKDPYMTSPSMLASTNVASPTCPPMFGPLRPKQRDAYKATKSPLCTEAKHKKNQEAADALHRRIVVQHVIHDDDEVEPDKRLGEDNGLGLME